MFCAQKQTELLEEIEQLLIKKVADIPQVNRSLLKREATFQELGLDSLSQVEAIVALEEMFGVNLSDEEAEKINTINDAITIFHLRVQEKLQTKDIQQ